MQLRRRQWHATPVLLPGESHGRRSLVGCGPWGREESEMTERLHFHFSLSCIGEGNGNPLQCSFLENPRDGVTQGRTRLKGLSSSSSECNLSLNTTEGLAYSYRFSLEAFFFAQRHGLQQDTSLLVSGGGGLVSVSFP